MFYRCKSCGGNVIYDPKKKAMVCESCGNGGEPDLISQEKKHVCNNCGAEIEADKIDLSLKCPYCGTYVIFEDRMRMSTNRIWYCLLHLISIRHWIF